MSMLHAVLFIQKLATLEKFVASLARVLTVGCSYLIQHRPCLHTSCIHLISLRHGYYWECEHQQRKEMSQLRVRRVAKSHTFCSCFNIFRTHVTVTSAHTQAQTNGIDHPIDRVRKRTKFHLSLTCLYQMLPGRMLSTHTQLFRLPLEVLG